MGEKEENKMFYKEDILKDKPDYEAYSENEVKLIESKRQGMYYE